MDGQLRGENPSMEGLAECTVLRLQFLRPEEFTWRTVLGRPRLRPPPPCHVLVNKPTDPVDKVSCCPYTCRDKTFHPSCSTLPSPAIAYGPNA